MRAEGNRQAEEARAPSPKEIHASMIVAYKTCPRMYYYQYVEGLVPKAEPTKLSLGRGVHAGLAGYYRTLSQREGMRAYEEWVSGEVPGLVANHPNPQELYDAVELGRKMLEAYFAYAAEHDDFVPVTHAGKPAIEVPFKVPIWTIRGGRKVNAIHVGTLDGVVRDNRGRIWLLEHKTAKDFPSEILLRLDEQVGLYLLAAWQIFGRELAGVIYNVIRKVDPARARGPVVKRWQLVRTGHELKFMRDRLYYASRQMMADTAFMPSPGHHCTWKCAYAQLCICDHDGADQTLLRQNFYVQTGGWRRSEEEE